MLSTWWENRVINILTKVAVVLITFSICAQVINSLFSFIKKKNNTSKLMIYPQTGPDSFSLYLRGNALTTVDEAVFGPLLPSIRPLSLYLEGEYLSLLTAILLHFLSNWTILYLNTFYLVFRQPSWVWLWHRLARRITWFWQVESNDNLQRWNFGHWTWSCYFCQLLVALPWNGTICALLKLY